MKQLDPWRTAMVDTGVLLGMLLGPVLLVFAYLLNNQQKVMWSMLERLGLVRPSREQSDTSIPDSVGLTRLADTIWEVCKPPRSQRPSLEIIFFTGLQPEFSNRPEVTAWLSRDKSELWLNWLRDENLDIRILVVYVPFSEMETGLNLHMVSENIVTDLIRHITLKGSTSRSNVGQDGCPLILVGHCLGGLVLKAVCLLAEEFAWLGDSPEDLRCFLDNVKGIFFFATPHHGADYPNCHIPIAKPLNADAARSNYNFSKLRYKRKWKVSSVGAREKVATGNFKGFIVSEASSRSSTDQYFTCNDDHFSICRPESRYSSSYLQLSGWLAQFTALKDEPRVSGTHGRVFFCGNQGVGKTTLRNTLSQVQSNPLSSKGSEREQLPRTRGIEVSYVEEQGIFGARPLILALWDLAGQHEYEVLHSAFLPDLSSGPATFFVIVCNANKSQGNDLESAHMHLSYWLKFISSSTLKNVPKEKRRRVLVVLNCFNGDTSNHDSELWTFILARYRESFKDYLDLLGMPFTFDATSPRAVTPLKNKLTEEAREMLQSRPMPAICSTVQELCKKWAKDRVQYPVLRWEDYSYLVKQNLEASSQLLEPATEYLHGTGHLILLKHARPSSRPDQVVHKDLVILETEWFCKRVVGYVLLPKNMIESGEKDLGAWMEEDGSLPIFTLSESDLGHLIPRDNVEEALGLLSRLGLCYRLNSHDRIFVPALIQDNDPSGSSRLLWKGDPKAPQQAWIMGFSLVLKDSRTTLLPIAPLRRLQVDLAERSDIGGRPDCKYRAWKSCITFKFQGLDVLVQYIGDDPRTATQTRLDVLVKPFAYESDFSSQKKRQVKFAHEMVDKFLDITNTSCPGVELERRIIKPRSVQKGYKDARARDIKISVELVANGLRDYQKLNWTVCGVQVTGEDVLPEEELRPHLLLRYEKIAVGVDILVRKGKIEDFSGFPLNQQQDVTYTSSDRLDVVGHRGLDKEVASNLSEGAEATQHRESSQEATTSNVSSHVITGSEVKSQPQKDFVRKDSFAKFCAVVLGRFDRSDQTLHEIKQTVEVVARTSNEINCNIEEIRSKTQELVLRLQNVETFSLEDKENSVPRFTYVTETGKGKTKWVTDFKKILQKQLLTAYKLHFYCEAPHDSSEIFHKVEGQEGIDLRKLKDWVKKLIPILKWALPIIAIASKIAVQVVLPGVQQVLPGIPQNVINPFTPQVQGLGELANYFSEEIERLDSQQAPGIENDKQLRGQARVVVKKLLDEARAKGVYEKQVGLTRVWLTKGGSTKGRVVYICKKCHEKYTEDEAHEID